MNARHIAHILAACAFFATAAHSLHAGSLQFDEVRPFTGTTLSRGNDLAVDSDGNAYVTGQVGNGPADFDLDGVADTPPGGSRFFLAKYGPDLSLHWAVAASGMGNSLAHSIVLDHLGGIYVVGTFADDFDIDGDGIVDKTSTGGLDGFVARFDDGPGGPSLRWIRSIGGAAGVTAFGVAIDFNQRGYRAFVTGRFNGRADFNEDGETDMETIDRGRLTAGDVFLAAYDAGTGNLFGLAHGTGLGVKTAESVAAFGASTGVVACMTGAFAAHVDFEGMTLSSTRAGRADAYIICFEGFTEPPGNTDPALRRFAPRFADTFRHRSGNDIASYGQDFYLAATASGLSFFEHGGTDSMVRKYRMGPSTYGRIWERLIGGPEQDEGSGIYVLNNRVYSAGTFRGQADFDHDFLPEIGGLGGEDTFLAGYDQNGNFQWAASARSVESVIGAAIEPDVSGNVFLVGQTPGPGVTEVDFSGDGVRDYESAHLGFLARYTWELWDAMLRPGTTGVTLPLDVPGGIDNIIISGLTNAVFGDICDPESDEECESIAQQFIIKEDPGACDGNQAQAINDNPGGNCLTLTYIGEGKLDGALIALIPQDPQAGKIGFGLAATDDHGALFDYPFDTYPIPVGPSPFADYDIYTVEPVSGQTKRVTSLEGTGEFNPDWSPGGSLLVHDVVTFADDGTVVAQNLFVTDVASGTSTPLIGGEGGNDAAWSPDSSSILFDGCPHETEAQGCDPWLYVVPAGGGERTPVRVNARNGDWGPRGLNVVFEQISDGSIRTRNIRSGRERIVAESGFDPVWSPDGKYIAFANGGNLFRVRVNRSGRAMAEPEQLTSDHGVNGRPSWAPVNSLITFQSDFSGDADVYTLTVGRSPVFLAGAVGPGDFDPAWSPGGDHVAFSGITLLE